MNGERLAREQWIKVRDHGMVRISCRLEPVVGAIPGIYGIAMSEGEARDASQQAGWREKFPEAAHKLAVVKKGPGGNNAPARHPPQQRDLAS